MPATVPAQRQESTIKTAKQPRMVTIQAHIAGHVVITIDEREFHFIGMHTSEDREFRRIFGRRFTSECDRLLRSPFKGPRLMYVSRRHHQRILQRSK